MKDQDLQLEAVKAFPVWPEHATHILTRGNDSEPYDEKDSFSPAVKGEGFFDYRSLDGAKLMITPSYWQPFCTREQHIRKRIELFEGAEKECCGVVPNGSGVGYTYIKNVDGVNYLNLLDGWTEFKPHKFSTPIIHRPTPEELAYIAELDGDKKWAPEVDVKCIGNILDIETQTYSYVEVVPLRDLGSEWVVQVGEGGRPSYCDEFRPLKTKSEKDTEAAFDLVKDAVDLYQACEILVEAGYKK